MIQPIRGIQPLGDACLTGICGGTFIRRAVYICRADACLHCGRCQTDCPTGAIFIHQGRPVIDPCLCTDCGRCQKNCPAGAILRTVQLTTG